MIQFSIINNTQIDIADQTTMAISAGCKWIEVDPSKVSDEDLNCIINQCKNAEIILTFKHDNALLDKHRVHGIHLSPTDIDPKSIRDTLGGHPIVGIDASVDTDLKKLKLHDVDYLVVPGFPNPKALETLKQLCKKIEDSGIDFPIVAEGIITIDMVSKLIASGANGLNIDIQSLQGPLFEPSLKAYIEVANA